MFSHEFKKTFKVFARKKVLMFWSLIFPLILGVFFKLALGNVTESFDFKPIDVAISSELSEDMGFSHFRSELTDVLNVHIADDERSLDDGDVIAYIPAEDQMIVKKNGIFESIVESLLKSYVMNKSILLNIMEDNPSVDYENIIVTEDHIEETSPSDNMDLINTHFYTLIGMQIMYGYSWGLAIVYLLEANLSTKAKRNAISPTDKKITMAASLLVGYIFNFIIAMVTMFAFNKFLGVDFSKNTPALMALIGVGALTGVVFGMLIGVSNKKNTAFKNGLGIGLSLFMSFLAGMQSSSVKILIAEKAPLLNKINPVALITDAMYSLYFYDGLARFYNNLLWLSLVTLVMIGLTYFFMRGKQYDSL